MSTRGALHAIGDCSPDDCRHCDDDRELAEQKHNDEAHVEPVADCRRCDEIIFEYGAHDDHDGDPCPGCPQCDRLLAGE